MDGSEEQRRKLRLRYEVSYRGEQLHDGNEYPTWRVELLDDAGEVTDIWSECWCVSKGVWICSNERTQCENLLEGISVSLASLLEYSGFDEE